MPIHEREYRQLQNDYLTEEALYLCSSPEERLFVTQDRGATRYEVFDYFPHGHYDLALKGYERLLRGPGLESVVDELLEDQW